MKTDANEAGAGPFSDTTGTFDIGSRTFENRTWIQQQEHSINPESSSPLDPDASPPKSAWKFKVLTYNLLSDQYAMQFGAWLYKDVPAQCLPWETRCPLLIADIKHWEPDVVCLQECSQYADIFEGLSQEGYEGHYARRPGGKRMDGCATLWKSSRFRLIGQKVIDCSKEDLDENVALIMGLRPLFWYEKLLIY